MTLYAHCYCKDGSLKAGAYNDKNGKWFNDIVETVNYPFKAKLKFVDSIRMVNATYFVWRDEKDQHYFMFVGDIAKVLKQGLNSDGIAEGLWMVTKRGGNHGIILLDDQQIESMTDQQKSKIIW